MPFSNREQTILDDIRKAKSIFPDLGELLVFYEKVFQLQFAYKDRLAKGGKAESWEKREIRLQALETGFPQVRFEELELEPGSLLSLARDLLGLLIPYTGSDPTIALESSSLETQEWAREIFVSQGPLVISGTLKDILKTATGLALAPHLFLACEGILPRLPPNLWYREFCPVCGGNPSFAALVSNTAPRTLLCPRCFGEWTYGRIGCPFCRDRESQSYYPGEDGRYRLYVCEVCRRYLKTVDARERGLDLCLPVANLVTVSLDLAAREKGYRF